MDRSNDIAAAQRRLHEVLRAYKRGQITKERYERDKKQLINFLRNQETK